MPDSEIFLQPKQAQLLDLLEATGPNVPRRIGWGGSRGAAKSGGLRRVAMVLAASHPGIVIVIIRKHLGDLLENHVEKMRLEYPDFHERYYKQSQYEWRLDNKSRIILAYGDTPKDIQEFSRGPEYTFAFIDQAEQFTEQELVWLTIPNRWPNAAQGFAKTAFFFNPGGPGTEFLRRVFHLKDFKKNEVPHEWFFVQAHGWDNAVWFQNEMPLSSRELYLIPGECGTFPQEERTGPQCCRFHIFIHETSEGRKMNALAPALRVGELLGSFESFSGQYFAGVWDEGQCVVSSTDTRLMIQPWWKRWMAIDWGFAHHTAVIWFAAGKLSPLQFQVFFGTQVEWPVDIIIAYRELVVNETEETDLGLQAVDMTLVDERGYVRHIWLGPDAFAKKGSASTVADQLSAVFTRAKLPKVDRAMNDRIAGWRAMYNLIRQTRGLRAENPDPARAKAGPMFVVSAECPELIAAIPLAVRDEKNLEDVLKMPTVGDDVIDACFVSSTPVLTPAGGVFISELRAGDLVETPIGPRPVNHAWLSRRNASIVEAEFSDGTRLRCTSEHRLWSEETKSFIPLNAMRYGDRISKWSQLLTGDASTLSCHPVTTVERSDSCIATYGRTPMGRFQRAITSITRMETGATTISLIWNACQAPSIYAGTTPGKALQPKHGIWNESGRSLRRGMGRQRASNGIKDTLRNSVSAISSTVKSFASAAAQSLQPSPPVPAFAPISAGQSGGAMPDWTTWNPFAAHVECVSPEINTKRPSTAQGNVRLVSVQEAGKADVYDIEVDEANSFYAGGILVHNCRYGIASHLHPRETAPLEVRAAEAVTGVQDNTARAMILGKFHSQNHSARPISRRKRFR